MTKRDQLGIFELMVILVLVRLGDNAYGVPICEELEKRTGREAAVGSVYAALERLEEKGFVTSELGEPTSERGGRAKKYFRVTARGLKEVRETQRSLVRLWQGLPEMQGGRVWDQTRHHGLESGCSSTSALVLTINPFWVIWMSAIGRRTRTCGTGDRLFMPSPPVYRRK